MRQQLKLANDNKPRQHPGSALSESSWAGAAAKFFWIVMISACLQLSTNSPGQAETWKSEGNWVISGSPKLRGCTMATRFRNGSFLSVSAVTSKDGQRIWELLVSKSAWNEIQSEAVYSVQLHFLGAAQPPRQIDMTGFKSHGTQSLVTNALVLGFDESSDLMAFVSEGLETGRNVALAKDGLLLGSFVLDHASIAYGELKECLRSRASNYEA